MKNVDFCVDNIKTFNYDSNDTFTMDRIEYIRFRRKAAIEKWMKKRQRRINGKIRVYKTERSVIALKRPRFKGRFLKSTVFFISVDEINVI